jgi:hypothetical protein
MVSLLVLAAVVLAVVVGACRVEKMMAGGSRTIVDGGGVGGASAGRLGFFALAKGGDGCLNLVGGSERVLQDGDGGRDLVVVLCVRLDWGGGRGNHGKGSGRGLHLREQEVGGGLIDMGLIHHAG